VVKAGSSKPKKDKTVSSAGVEGETAAKRRKTSTDPTATAEGQRSGRRKSRAEGQSEEGG